MTQPRPPAPPPDVETLPTTEAGAGPEAGHHAARDPHLTPGLAALAFAALGVVYGDIGTSPLYALRACFDPQVLQPTPENVYGVLSLVFWALILVVSVWYLTFILRADNRGEGGLLALMALATFRGERLQRHRRLLVGLGLLGTALVYGDGVITPAISVLGAMEGLKHATPVLEPFVVPLTLVVLLVLFLIQRRGTAGVAKLFSPVTATWFASITLLGLPAIARHPSVLLAVNPAHAVRFFLENHWIGFLVLGSVFLVITGAEALYADMGHFGRRPIRAAWFGLVLPALLVNYFGQGALLLTSPDAADNPFYRLVPEVLLYPMIVLATLAAVVASQAIISGVFSLTRQAQQLGYLPRVKIIHTSHHTVGQIYVPTVSRALLLACIALVLGFQSAENLAEAYGIAVSATMPITTILFSVVARRRFGWSRGHTALLCGFFLTIDLAFFGANLVKITHGGWFPILVATIVWVVMSTWREGMEALQRLGRETRIPLTMLLEDVGRRHVPRVPGTAVFMSNVAAEEAPIVLLHHLKHNKVLHDRVVLLRVVIEEVPTIPDDERLETRGLEHGFHLVTVRYGFMETPNAPEALARCRPLHGLLKAGETTYYLGRQTLVPTGGSGMAVWRKKLFRFMARNAVRATAYFRLPPNRVVELGAQVRF